ncbi:hypothetical protein G3M81_22355 [Bacillus paralicheniformis]|uniref:hypothetical protein n=1 Tax=Bacillus paralicheniformis TaxID=1648923 RepID=UPI0013EF18FB|nr:hypothetical protein [Bacillus paralicheniformis]QII51314.1 hypothetical protein G3M81_22355 [Bacillus paralicheniformis]
MNSSKRDADLLFKLISNFISNLTEDQYKQLITGEAEIKLKTRKLDSDTVQQYKKLLFELVSIKDIKKRTDFLLSKMSKKSELINFNNYLNITYKSRDTVQKLVDNIIDYSLKNEGYIRNINSKEQKSEEQFKKLSVKLQEVMDINEAEKILRKSSISNRKIDLLEFGKQLSVFPDKRMSIDEIINEIVQSVVAAKLRSYKIRKKI